VGIAIGVILFVLAIIGLIWFIMRRRNRYEPVANPSVPVVQVTGVGGPHQIGADSYVPAVRGGYVAAPQDEYRSILRPVSITRRPVGAGPPGGLE
jgi:hypothetical protein